MIDTPVKQLQTPNSKIHPGVQFLVFMAIAVGLMIVCNIILLAIYGFDGVTNIVNLKPGTPHLMLSLWIMQLFGTTLPIIAAPVFFSYVVVNEPKEYLKANFRFNRVLIIIVMLVIALSFPCIELLSNINQQMKLPHFLKGLEDWMKESESSAQKTTDAMLQMNSTWDMLRDVLLIGLLPAIVEEFMFRGVMQTIFFRWTKNTHAAIWITAAIFSAIHLEFYGFLPRLLLGALFGYFVVWSGSLWPAVLGHFLNNATDVVLTYLYQHKVIKDSPDDQHMFSNTGYLIGFVLLLVMMLLYRRIAFEKNKIPAYDGEKLG